MSKKAIVSKTLYVVSTPIGNLGDISARALTVLSQVDTVAAEDTRHSQRLLQHFGLTCQLTSLHGHNEQSKVRVLIEKLESGESIALISDAGTPLISDPGAKFISAAVEAGINIVAVPGACAAIAALSISGMATEQFIFEGFLPARPARRCKRLAALSQETRTLVFYEAVHRVIDFLHDCQRAFGGDRSMVVARELTKQYENVVRGSIDDIILHYQDHQDQIRGEFVIVVQGCPNDAVEHHGLDPHQVLKVLLTECSPSKAAALAAKLLDGKKSEFYALANKISQASNS